MEGTKIYFPTDSLKGPGGLLLGWLVGDSVTVAATVTPAQATKLTPATLEECDDVSCDFVRRSCLGLLEIIGTVSEVGHVATEGEERTIGQYRKNAAVWVDVRWSLDFTMPLLCEIRPGAGDNRAIQEASPTLVCYNRPSGNHYVALDPLLLTWVAPSDCPIPTCLLDAVLNQINLSMECENALCAVGQSGGSIYSHMCAGKPIGHHILRANPLDESPSARWTTLHGSFLLKVACGMHRVTRAINMALMWMPHGHSLATITHTGARLAQRCQECMWWLPSHSLATRHYPRCHNTRNRYVVPENVRLRWIFDTLLGCVLGMLLYRHADACALFALTTVKRFTIMPLYTTVEWLMGAPAGLKLNQPLDVFLGTVFIQYTQWWEGVMRVCGPAVPSLLRASSCFGVLGATVLCSVLVDMVQVLTLHVVLMQRFAARIYTWALHSLASTWRHFRGKKWNVLRQRVDSCVLAVDQLVLNTVLFTILLFIVPTIALYYAVFSVFSSGVAVVIECISTLLALFDTLPLYALVLRVKDGLLLPGGIYFDVIVPKIPDAVGEGLKRPVYIEMKNRALSLGGIFTKSIGLIGSLIRHYNPGRLLLLFAQGEPLPVFIYHEEVPWREFESTEAYVKAVLGPVPSSQ